MRYLIETKNLTKKYGDSVVVNNVNISVPKGKIYGLLGRNGAGKTTLMKMLLKLIKSSDGEVYLFGEQSKTVEKKVYRRIGSIIETPGFYENLTAYENLNLAMRLRGYKEENKIKEALTIVGLEKEVKKQFGDYSLGMKQRLGLAAALMHEPELLILDEPTNGLDPIGIANIRDLFKTLCEDKKMTILISSHALTEIEQIADIIGIMHEGNLIEEIKVAEINNKNLEDYFYQLIGGGGIA